MAAGGATESEKRFHFPSSNIILTITEGNVIETSAAAIATGEDKSMGGHGSVSQLLLKTCPQAYKSAREQLKKSTKKFEFCKIYPCNFPNPRKHPMSFTIVLHAIVPSASVVKSQKEWMDQMKELYYNLFQAANTQGRSSLAMPLLGSGGASASLEVAFDVLIHAITTFTFKPDLKSSHQYLRDIILYLRKEAFSKMMSRIQEKLKELPHPNGIVPLSSVSGIGKTSLASSKSRTSRAAGRSGRGSLKHSGSMPSGIRGAASAPTGRAQTLDQMSNLTFILADVGLDSKSLPEEQAEEEIDFDLYSDIEDEDEAEETESKDEKEEEEKCAICLDVMDNPKKLDKCGHTFCKDCIEQSFSHKPACPNCNTMYGIVTGNQPKGTMRMMHSQASLSGYQNCGQIIIDYVFPSGIQGPEHPNPGQMYRGTSRRAFLPDCAEGRKVYRLLCVAFEKRLIFTIGRSVTTGYDNVVTWNDIHHKTRPDGGATGFGYPDPHYLSRVQEELAAKGVTEECLQGRPFNL